ncbi:MAG: PD-(D/E)XK nuclease family transposase [Bacilli bacterium]|nr:PD-(D/E)XK nuclease family transposase [Bacilli bacterium]
MLYLKDQFATKIFTECREFVKEFLSVLLAIDKKELESNLILEDIRVGESAEIKKSITDALYSTDDGIYNIEINYNRYKGLEIKNVTYICHLILRQAVKGQDYKKLKPITQININSYDYFNKKEFVYISKLLETKHHLVRSNLIQIIDINLNYLLDKEFNKLHERLEKLMYIFVCGNMDKVREISKGDSVMEEVRARMETFAEEFDSLLFYDREALLKEADMAEAREIGYNEGFSEGLEHGIEQGIEQGIQKGINQGFESGKVQGKQIAQKSIAKKLIEHGMSEEEVNKIIE